MRVITPPMKAPIITVFRKQTGPVTRCWFFANSRPVEMSEQLAILEAKRGNVNIKTVGDA